VKYLIYILTIFILSLFSNFDASAQNPKQSTKHKKAAKHGKKKGEPYTIQWGTTDSDGDGVPDVRDKCIHTPKGEPVTPFGCPFDTDFDGIYDYEDSCKTEKGPKENKGCPWGDRDKDGIRDNVDECPSVFGIVAFHGCPDTDGDGIKDSDDKCPKERGTIKYFGCPPPFIDTDKDGIDDYSDLCPKVFGVKSNKGCPEIKPEEKAALQKAFDNLLFESNKDVIVSSSYASLDGLAKVMRNNPRSKLHLEGHTDNVGDDAANMDLSKRRAISVKNYLISKGVGAERLTTDGFGETKPVTENETEEGRHRNRRVEMNIIYDSQ
jgi:OmpA-OmpF porin, OOP family